MIHKINLIERAAICVLVTIVAIFMGHYALHEKADGTCALLCIPCSTLKSMHEGPMPFRLLVLVRQALRPDW